MMDLDNFSISTLSTNESLDEQVIDATRDNSVREYDADVDKNSSFKESDNIQTVLIEEDLTPKLGMIFGSIDEAYDFYRKYAYHMGFGITKRSLYSFHGKVNGAKFICSKGGKPRIKSDTCKVRKKPITKTNCMAMMHVKDKYFQGNWEVVQLELEHNHPFNVAMVRFMPCYRDVPLSVEKQLEINDRAGVPLNKSINTVITQGGGHEKCTFNEKDCRNIVDKIRKLRLGEGDAEALMKYFYTMQNQNSNFFYSIELNEEGRLRNVFWVDARSRASYQYFGDVISFDSTYLTNRYNMPFAPFVGVNHHGQTVLLGCGLLADETTETYVWLFKMWLSCMNGKSPNAIITDQCRAIRSAIEEVFPHARHRFCLWHIMRKIPEKLGKYKENEAISNLLCRAIYDSLTIFDFETKWNEMIQRYKLEDNVWLNSLYEDKERWVPVFVKDTFWAGMFTTQRSERTNAFLDGYVTSKTSLKQFVEQYENALRSKYEKEAQEDYRSFHMKPQLISALKMDEQIANVYTINIFMKFQDEIKQMIQLHALVAEKNGPLATYQVIELSGEKHLSYRVIYNSADQEIWCICRSFQFRGILCRHALFVLKMELVTELPSKYILDRWRKDFKRVHASISLEQLTPMREMKFYDNLYMQGHQYFADIVELGAKNLDAHNFPMAALKEALDKVIKYDEFHYERTNNENLAQANDDVQCDAQFNSTFEKVLDPLPAHPKGRRPTKRLISTREKAINNKKKILKRANQSSTDKVSVVSKKKMKHTQVEDSNIFESSSYHSNSNHTRAISTDLSLYSS